LLVNVGEPITYVSRQMGHKDSSITLRVYARWLADGTGRKGVDLLDSAAVAKNLQGAASVTLRSTA
jgi:integrase